MFTHILRFDEEDTFRISNTRSIQRQSERASKEGIQEKNGISHVSITNIQNIATQVHIKSKSVVSPRTGTDSKEAIANSFGTSTSVEDDSTRHSFQIKPLDLNKRLKGPMVTRALHTVNSENSEEIKDLSVQQQNEFTANIKFEEEPLCQGKNCSLQFSEMGSKNTSQVIRIENFEKVMADSPCKSLQKSRFSQWEEIESPPSHKTVANTEESNAYFFQRGSDSISTRHSRTT